MPKVKRLSKIIHPNSRRALELASKEHHKTRTIRSKIETKNKSNILIRKLLWFRNQISETKIEADDVEMDSQQEEDVQEETNCSESEVVNKTKPFYTNEDIHKLISLYFHRFDDELEQISTKNSIGKRNVGQNFSREKAIEMTLNTEKNEYETSGLVVPDLCNPDNVKFLRAWNGKITLLPAIKLKSIKKI